MPFKARRMLAASAISIGVVMATLGPESAQAGPGGNAGTNAGQPAQDVIVVLRDQHSDLGLVKGQRSPRVEAAQRDQAPVIATARRAGARNVRGFKVVNGFTATVTPDQAAQIAADPAVRTVFPDLQIRRSPRLASRAGPGGGGSARGGSARG